MMDRCGLKVLDVQAWGRLAVLRVRLEKVTAFCDVS